MIFIIIFQNIKKIMKNQIKIGDIKIPILNDYLKKRGFIHTKIVSSWATLTKEYAKFSSPIKIKFAKSKFDDGTLFIKVKSGLGPELEMKSINIINRINSMFGYKAINKIKFQNGYFEDEEIKNNKIIENSKLNIKFNQKIKKIKNEKLADALFQLGKKIPE